MGFSSYGGVFETQRQQRRIREMKLAKQELSYKTSHDRIDNFVSIKKPVKNRYIDYKGLMAIALITYIMYEIVMMF